MPRHFRPLLAVLLVISALNGGTVVGSPESQASNERSLDARGFGLAFQAPPGWQRVAETSFSHLARYACIEGKRATGLIEVTSLATKGRPAAEVAAELAPKLGGRVADHPTAAKAPPGTLEIAAGPAGSFPASRAAVVPVRDTFVLVQVATSDPAALAPAFGAVVGSIALKPPTPAADDLSLRRPPIGLFDSGVLISLPEPFRPAPVKDPAHEMFLGARDWPTGKDEASLQIKIVSNPGRQDLAIVSKIMAAGLSEKLAIKPPMTFARANHSPEAWISTPFSTAGKDVQRVVQMRLDDDRIATLIFRSTAADPKARDKYMAMAQDVARECRVSAAYLEGRQSVPRPGKK